MMKRPEPRTAPAPHWWSVTPGVTDATVERAALGRVLLPWSVPPSAAFFSPTAEARSWYEERGRGGTLYE